MGDIDRKKHDVDIVERVMGYSAEDEDDYGARVEVIDVDVRPGFISSTVSASQLIVGGFAPHKLREPRNR